MNVNESVVMLVPQMESQIVLLGRLVFTLIAWNIGLTGLLLYFAFNIGHRLEDATCGFAEALQRSLIDADRKEDK